MRSLLALAVALSLGWFGRAHADKNDLVLSRLGQCTGGPDKADPCTGATKVIPNNQSFRSLMSELGVAIAPKFLAPADTLGYSGFQFSAEYAFTSINSSASYWCATEQSPGCNADQVKADGTLPTIGLFARKGIWLPLPSFELGAGAVHVFDSHLWAAEVFAKFALHEGFHSWPIPSLAVRGAASQLLGSEQIELFVASLDVTISKAFGVVGTFNLEPYAGWNYLWIIPRSEVIDKTPQVDAAKEGNTGDHAMNFVFPTQDNIIRQRFFGGLKFKYYVFALTAEVNFATKGSSLDDRVGTLACSSAPDDKKGACDAQDQSGAQQTYAISASLDF